MRINKQIQFIQAYKELCDRHNMSFKNVSTEIVERVKTKKNDLKISSSLPSKTIL